MRIKGKKDFRRYDNRTDLMAELVFHSFNETQIQEIMESNITINVFRENEEYRVKYFIRGNRTIVIKDLEEGVQYWLIIKLKG